MELNELHANSDARIRELEAKYRSGERLTRQDCQELRRCVRRSGLVAKELWLLAGEPEGAEFDILRGPIKVSPLPQSMRPLDLSNRNQREVH